MVISFNPTDLASGVSAWGDVGSGKSTLLMTACAEIERRGEVAVIMDPDQEFVAKFYSKRRGDWRLQPGHPDCPVWDIAKEARDVGQRLELASNFVPDEPGVRDPFWYRSARQLLAGLLDLGPTTWELAEMLVNDQLLAERMKGTDLEVAFNKNSAQMKASIILHLHDIGIPMRMLPMDDGNRRHFTVRDYLKHRDSWLFLSSSPWHGKATKPLHGGWLSLILNTLMAMGKQAKLPRMHIIMDEVGGVSHEEFHRAVIRLRKTGCPVWYAGQNFADVKHNFGDRAESIFSQPRNKFIFRTSNDATADKLEASCGMREVERLEVTRSYSGRTKSRANMSTSYRTVRIWEPVVRKTEIQNFPDRCGVLVTPEGVFPFELPVLDLPNRAERQTDEALGQTPLRRRVRAAGQRAVVKKGKRAAAPPEAPVAVAEEEADAPVEQPVESLPEPPQQDPLPETRTGPAVV